MPGGIFGDDFGVGANPVLQVDPMATQLQAQGPGGILAGMTRFANVGGRKLPLNEDGTVTLFHSTNRPAAEQIVQNRVLRSAGEPSIYFSTEPFGTGYGEHTVAVRLNPQDLRIDDEFPSGRADFRIDKKMLSVIDAQHFLPGTR